MTNLLNNLPNNLSNSLSKKIITIVGARPQFIKAAILSKALKNHKLLREIIIHTGQHFDKNMSDIFFDELQIPKPHYFLNINKKTHGQMTGSMLGAIEEILIKEKPDAIIVYGDTNSTLAAALAASKLHIPIIHIESGLRSYNKRTPEEVNRILTDHVSDIIFCSTKTAVANLQKEGITKGVYLVGDIMFDSMLLAKNFIETNKQRFDNKFSFLKKQFAVMTLHRQESIDNGVMFASLIDYAFKFAKENNLTLVFPVHPRIKDKIEQYTQYPNCHFLDPLSYFDMQYLLTKACYVLTDSGGLQKEAYFHQLPCITLRTETEWVETINSGWNRLWNCKQYNTRKKINEYGNGDTAKKIIKILEQLILGINVPTRAV